jgi:flagellar hook-length control protein FliK
VEHQLDLAADGAWLDQLAKDIAAAGEDGAPLRFRLNPETLGSLRVEVTQQRDGAAIRLTADTEAARAIIADAQPKLIAEARAQGVRISETHVDLGQGSASGDPRRQQASRTSRNSERPALCKTMIKATETRLNGGPIASPDT